MKRAAAQDAPVALRFAPELARADGWGRLTELTATSAGVSTMTKISRREKIFLSFELAGERFRDLPAEVLWVETDADGYNAAELRFLDQVESRRLSTVLLDALSR